LQKLKNEHKYKICKKKYKIQKQVDIKVSSNNMGISNYYLPLHIAYGGLALITSLLNNVFILFYVSTFISVFQIDSTSFLIGETVFLIWNSINDPLFGWLSDSGTLQNDSLRAHNDVVIKRIKALYLFGPLFALSFLLFWFELFNVGVQFSIALCLYDSFLTMVDLHHQALLADLTVEAKDRVRFNSYCSAASATGCISVFISYALWNKHNLFQFQLLCVGLSVFACFGFIYCCKSMLSYFEDKDYPSRSTNVSKIGNVGDAKKYTYQVLKHRNFLLFAAMNLIQVFHCHFNSNFFPIFIQHLLSHALTPTAAAILLGLSFLLPHINNLYFLQLCKRYGSYFIVKCLFITKLSLAIVMLLFGMNYWYLLCLFIVSNRIFTEGTCQLLNLIISDLVDEDFVKYKRKSPVSALVFGTAALLSKPGQTLAPLVGSYMLYLQTGKSIFMNQNLQSGINSENNHDYINHEDESQVKHGCFIILTMIPIVCAVMQLFIWQFFTLKDNKLKQVKRDRIHIEEKLNYGSFI